MHRENRFVNMFGRLDERGFSLIEMIVVVAIVGILLIAIGFSFEGWISAYRVEGQLKEMYGDFLNARMRAMQRNRVHFISLSGTGYTVTEDTNPAPDGNGSLETTSPADTVVKQKNDWSGLVTALATGGSQFSFDRNGQASTTGTVRLTTTATPDYDCIVLATTRANVGKWDGSACVVK